MALSPYHAVVFDFDGVIADTANIHVAAWERTFAVMGWKVPTEVCARAGSEDDRTFLDDVFSSQGIEGGDREGWVRKKQDLTRTMLNFAPRIYPGVAALLRELHSRSIPVGIVTGTWQENVATTLESGGLAPYVKTCVTKEVVTSPKPDPEGYLLACKRLKVEPAHALAVEDSLNGVEAATKAGMKVLALGHRQPQGDWTLGAPFVSDLRDPKAILQHLGLTV